MRTGRDKEPSMVKGRITMFSSFNILNWKRKKKHSQLAPATYWNQDGTPWDKDDELSTSQPIIYCFLQQHGEYHPGWYFTDEAEQLHGPFETIEETCKISEEYGWRLRSIYDMSNSKLDRNGKEIKIGDVVAQAITLNHDTFKGFTFTTRICRWYEGEVILDGVYGYSWLYDTDSKELEVIDKDTDMSSLEYYFSTTFRKR